MRRLIRYGVIIVAGVPLRAPGTTNMLRIASVGPDEDAQM